VQQLQYTAYTHIKVQGYKILYSRAYKYIHMCMIVCNCGDRILTYYIIAILL